ncbi:MAG: hypothetical protein KGI04_02385 [Candidatus Micrarchaeota archaeon]|nr:hypothetical protein [Candidatus Micrarchaeota archaeon]
MAKDAFDRMLAYQARHSGWIIFRSVYWAIYLLLLGIVLIFYSAASITISLQVFLGWAFTLAGIMIIIYGATETLHHKLMRKYG